MAQPARFYQQRMAHYIKARIRFDTPGIAAGVQVGAIPPGSQILGAVANVKTAFSAGGTVNMGSTALGAQFAATATVAPTTAGGKRVDTGLGIETPDNADTPVYVSVGGAPTAGEMTIVLMFAPQHTA